METHNVVPTEPTCKISNGILTPHCGGPGAVVEDGQLSENFSWSHGAQLHPLFGHLHLPL